jgi:putative protein-disulfide isomerase
MKPIIIYCYDAWCGWCYGFSPVIKSLHEKYKTKFDFETISGGMIPVDATQHIGKIAGYIKDAYKTVEQMTGIKFGTDFLWHINNPDLSDWHPNSEMAAIAMSILKDFNPDRSIEFAADLQFALYSEGRDLTDPEAYRHLIEKYEFDPKEFYEKLKSEEYKEKAYYDFSLIKQLNVNGFPTLFIQISESKLYMIARGYSDQKSIEKRIDDIMLENNIQ